MKGSAYITDISLSTVSFDFFIDSSMCLRLAFYLLFLSSYSFSFKSHIFCHVLGLEPVPEVSIGVLFSFFVLVQA